MGILDPAPALPRDLNGIRAFLEAGSPASDWQVAFDPWSYVAGDMTYDPDTGALIGASIFFPADQTFGTFTVDALNATFRGAVDEYHVTKGVPTVATYSQDTVTRDPLSGAVTYRPPLVVGFPPGAYDFTIDELLLADFDADSLGAVNGVAVSSWTPQAGSLLTPVTQGTTSAKPSVKTNALFGHNSALFGGDDFLSGTYSNPPAQPITRATVWKAAAVGATQWIVAGLSSSGGTLELNVTTSGTLQMKAGTLAAFGAAGTSFGAFHISVAVYNGAQSVLYRDARTPVASGTVQSGDLPSSLGATRFGRSTTAGTGFLTGEIVRHVIIGRALHGNEVTDLLEQLAAVYDLTIGA